jgi:ATP-binding protein involved in chromosome partitioning
MKRIAIPLVGGKFSEHFGGAEQFALVTVDETTKKPTSIEVTAAPPHARGAFPAWLRERRVDAVIVGGIGGRASSMFSAYGIDVVTGVEGGDPAALATAYVAGELSSRGSRCEGGHLHDCDHHEHP